jgi:radical SAM protein with 4Fe4S-binding SPASM domain
MDCPKIHEINYNDWSLALHNRVHDKRIPISGSLELTFRCNNNCIHCYCNLPAGDRAEIFREMDTFMIKRILDQIADEGCLWLLITGGEPLLRTDFKEIYLYAKKKGMLIILFTNGTLIDEKMADFLAEWMPYSIEITLYGASEKTYEAVTRVKGSYRKCMKGIEILLERKIPLELKAMAIKQNVYEIPLMKRYAEGLGLRFRFDPIINARLDMNKGPLSTRLDVEDVVRLDLEDEKRLKEWKEFCDKFIGSPDSDRLYTCGAGLNSFHIDPYGNLTICIIARKDFYDLKTGSFKEGWYNFIGGLRERTLSSDNRCSKCDLMSLCGQCPGWAQIEHGDDETPVDYLCEIAHKRADAFGVKVLSPYQ